MHGDVNSTVRQRMKKRINKLIFELPCNGRLYQCHQNFLLPQEYHSENKNGLSDSVGSDNKLF